MLSKNFSFFLKYDSLPTGLWKIMVENLHHVTSGFGRRRFLDDEVGECATE